MSRITILRDVSAAPDHNHTRLYKKGEVPEVGSPLMPEGLANALTSQFIPARIQGLVSNEEVANEPVVPFAEMDNKPVSVEVQKTNAEAYAALVGSGVILPW